MKRCEDLQVGDIIIVTTGSNMALGMCTKIINIDKLGDFRVVYCDHLLYPLCIGRDQMVLVGAIPEETL